MFTENMLSSLCGTHLGLTHVRHRAAPLLTRCAASLTSRRDQASAATFHDAWRVRLYDSELQRSYALDFGHFFQDRAAGPTSTLSFIRIDQAAGRPRTAKPQLKGLLCSAKEETTLRGPVTAYATAFNLVLEDSGYSLLVAAEDSSANLKFETTDAAYQGKRPAGRVESLLEQGDNNLKIQSLKSDATYSFDDTAGNREQGAAKLFVQRMWGNLTVPAAVICLGHSFSATGDTWASLQLNIAEQAFRVGFLSRDLQQSQQWDFSSANPDHSLVSEIEADYGKLQITVSNTATGEKLVIRGAAPHRTFDLWAVPTGQGFLEKGIQTFNATVAITATSPGHAAEELIMEGVNLQFGAKYAAKVVERMTGTQFSSPLRYKGKGVTR